MQKSTKKVAPDGGWGWMACFGVSLVNLATRSIEPSFGLLFGDLLNDLQVGTTGAAVIMSALDVTMNFSGLFVGPLLKEFSYRKVAIAGSLLCAIGLAFTSTAKSMPHILATYSVINGMGVGLATSAAFVALNHYFKEKRGQAVGLSMAGTALGMLILPQLVRILLEVYGFRGAVLVLSGLALHAAFGSALLQPVKWHLKEEKVDVEMQAYTPYMEPLKEDENDELPEMKTLLHPPPVQNGRNLRKNFSEVAISSMNNGLPKRPTFPRIMSNGSNIGSNGLLTVDDNSLQVRRRKASVMSQLSTLDFMGSNLHVYLNVGDDEAEQEDRISQLRRVNTALGMSSMHEINSNPKLKNASITLDKPQFDIGVEIQAPPKQSFWKRFITLMDVSLLKDRGYLNILFGLSIFYVAEMNFKMITPFFFANLGYSKADVAYCLSITAISDIAARVVLPPICDRLKISKRLIFFVSIAFVAVTRSIMAEQTEWSQLMIWLFICGFFRGMALSNFTLTVSEYCSLEQLPAAFGWHMVGKGVFVVALGPLIGAIRDITGSYSLCIHSQSLCISMCCIAWTIEYVIKRLRNKRNELETEPTTATTNSIATTPNNNN